MDIWSSLPFVTAALVTLGRFTSVSLRSFGSPQARAEKQGKHATQVRVLQTLAYGVVHSQPEAIAKQMSRPAWGESLADAL